MKTFILSLSTLFVGLAGCGQGDLVIGGKSLDPCVQSIPACARQTAQCNLDPSRYAEVRMPGIFSFITEVDAGNELEVVLVLAEQRDAGLDTQILWYEPGCTDFQVFASEGRNLFRESEDTGIFSETRVLEEGGEHLIEIFSDMQADLLVTIEVREPGTK